MTLPVVLDALRTSMLTIPPPTPPGGLLTVYADPKDAVSGGNFPCMYLALAPLMEHGFKLETMGGVVRHTPTIAIYLSICTLQVPLNERHALLLPWPELITAALVARLKLGGAVQFIGNDGEQLWTYRPQATAWADGMYWGLRGLLPVTDKIVMALGA